MISANNLDKLTLFSFENKAFELLKHPFDLVNVFYNVTTFFFK